MRDKVSKTIKLVAAMIVATVLWWSVVSAEPMRCNCKCVGVEVL